MFAAQIKKHFGLLIELSLITHTKLAGLKFNADSIDVSLKYLRKSAERNVGAG